MVNLRYEYRNSNCVIRYAGQLQLAQRSTADHTSTSATGTHTDVLVAFRPPKGRVLAVPFAMGDDGNGNVASSARWLRDHAAFTRALCQQRSASRSDKAMLYAQRGHCALRRGQLAAALRDLNAAVHLAPDVAANWQLRAQVRRRLGEDDIALDDIAVSVNLDAERLGCIFSELLPPVARPPRCPDSDESKLRGSPGRRRNARRRRKRVAVEPLNTGGPVLPRDDRGLPMARKSPEQLFEQARPELASAALSYASREAERHRENVRAQQQAEAREQEQARQEAKAEADAQAARKLRLLHSQYIELELAKTRSQLLQLDTYTKTLAQRIAEIDETLEATEHSRAVLEEEVRVIETGSAALRRSKKAAMKREEFASAVQSIAAKLQKIQELQQLQHQAVQRQAELRASVQRLKNELNEPT